VRFVLQGLLRDYLLHVVDVAESDLIRIIDQFVSHASTSTESSESSDSKESSESADELVALVVSSTHNAAFLLQSFGELSLPRALVGFHQWVNILVFKLGFDSRLVSSFTGTDELAAFLDRKAEFSERCGLSAALVGSLLAFSYLQSGV
jgi:hypothetical protein